MIRIPAPLLGAITGEAEAAYPEECCGLLVGRVDGAGLVVTRVQPSPNKAEGDRRKTFLVDETIHFELMRDIRGGPEDIVGNYHSHPDGPSRPSEHDRQSVFYPEHVWVIVTVPEGRAGDVAAWRFDEEAEAFREIDLVAEGPRDGGASP
ncbi:MAG: Mov34/MPN/PAD-1 family protein [Rhodospirillales bacterium]